MVGERGRRCVSGGVVDREAKLEVVGEHGVQVFREGLAPYAHIEGGWAINKLDKNMCHVAV